MHFQIVCLSNLSVLMLCLKNSQIGNDTIHLELLLIVRVSVGTKLPECLQLKNKKHSLLTINNHLLFDVQTAYNSTKEREKIC